MRLFLKQILKIYLKLLTKLALAWHRPKIIAVAGSTNKPFVKEIIKNRLVEAGYSARANPKNFNTEIGLPLSVLGMRSGYDSVRSWLPLLAKAPALIWQKDFPKYLVLSLGASDPGDMKYLLTIVRPDITVITELTQRYLEGFKDMDELAREYEYLISRTKTGGLLVINIDNPRLKALKTENRLKTASFGYDRDAAWRIVEARKSLPGQTLAYSRENKGAREMRIKGYGRHQQYAGLIGEIIFDYVQSSKKE